jgi:hypothetical protein
VQNLYRNQFESITRIFCITSYQILYFKLISQTHYCSTIHKTSVKSTGFLLVNHRIKRHLKPSYRESAVNLYVQHCPNTFLQKSCFEPPTLKIRTDLIINLKITKFMSKWLELSYLTIAKRIVWIQVTGSDNLPF